MYTHVESEFGFAYILSIKLVVVKKVFNFCILCIDQQNLELTLLA